MHRLFTGLLPEQVFAPRPPAGVDAPLDDAWATATTRLIEDHAGELAAVICEPVVQGAGGMHFYSPAYVRLLRELCDRHAALLILDEIATGFGRTGALFAADTADVRPDVMCVGKALTGGYLTLAATLCTPALAEAIGAGEAGALMHGPTFMANPLACSAALASTGLLLDGDWQTQVARIESELADGLVAARELPGVLDVRVLGAIGAIQMNTPVDLPSATEAAVSRGVWLRPFNDLVYTMPPYVASADDTARITAAMVAVAAL
jgi:adenosylmethionine-8-amino-7-oxononanoate aminotransferase